MGFTLLQRVTWGQDCLGTGGPHNATTSDPSCTVLGLASIVTPWLWSHTRAHPGSPGSPCVGMGVQVPVCELLNMCVLCRCVHTCAQCHVGGWGMQHCLVTAAHRQWDPAAGAAGGLL